ncbi:MAG: hypothetical protein WC552_09890 [Candidatus Omnitrophota bacterium]
MNLSRVLEKFSNGELDLREVFPGTRLTPLGFRVLASSCRDQGFEIVRMDGSRIFLKKKEAK